MSETKINQILNEESPKTTIQAKLDKIDEICNWFTNDEFNIDQAMEKYEEAMKLSLAAEKEINELNNRFQILQEHFDKISE